MPNPENSFQLSESELHERINANLILLLEGVIEKLTTSPEIIRNEKMLPQKSIALHNAVLAIFRTMQDHAPSTISFPDSTELEKAEPSQDSPLKQTQTGVIITRMAQSLIDSLQQDKTLLQNTSSEKLSELYRNLSAAVRGIH